jgi:hypothetical protein
LDHYQGPTSIDTYRTVNEPVTLCTQTTTRCIGSVTADIEHRHAASMLRLRLLLLLLLLLRLQFG